MKDLVIFGATDAAELAHYYFTKDSDYRVAAFSVDSEYIRMDSFCGLPVIPFENVTSIFPPDKYDFFVALGYSGINKNRMKKYNFIKSLGYKLASYISSHSTILNEHNIGDNCFVLEDNTIQPFVSIGNNVTLWSGNHIGHHSIIHDHCFLTSHVVVSGRVELGEACFVGVNATLRDNIRIGSNSVIGAGALILSDVESGSVYVGNATECSRVPSSRLRKI